MSPLKLQSWLTVLCQSLPNVSCAIVAEIEQDSCLPPTVYWPAETDQGGELLRVARLAARQGKPLVRASVFAHPLTIDGQLAAVVAVSLAVEKKQRPIVQQLLQWSEQWLRPMLESVDAGEGGETAVTAAALSPLPALEQVLPTEPLQAAVLALNNHVAGQFNCERVALGLVRGKRVRVQGLSHGLEFDARTELIREIEAAMDEVHAGARVVNYPLPGASADEPLPAVAQLWADRGQRTLCAVPLGGGEQAIGVMLCERPSGQAFTPGEQAALAALGRLLGPVLELKQAHGRAWSRRLLATANGALDRLVTPGHRGFKLAVAGALLVVLVLGFARGTFRVSADASVEGMIQRAVVAPFDGYIAEAYARAGDTVLAGAPIARLDDRELALELRKSVSEEAKLDKEYRKALASLERSEARIVQSQLAQVQAQSELLQQKLARIQLNAPLAGYVLSGDLSRSLGAPVERGQVLFEVAPLDAYRLVLQIDERAVDELAVGQRGLLTLTALPQESWSFVIEQVSPVFTEREGKVSYRTEARIEGDVARLRPGMEGVGKVDIGRRSFGWILFHQMWDWLLLQLWLWLP